jgi:hypothetical protein
VELTAKLEGMPLRRHSVTVVDGEETSVAFNMASGSSSSTHHHRRAKKDPPSALAKLGDSLKSFFAGQSGHAKSGAESK